MQYSISDMQRRMHESKGHLIEVRFLDGTSPYIGKCIGYTKALDNEPEIASIDVRVPRNGTTRLYEFMENEISEIIFLD